MKSLMDTKALMKMKQFLFLPLAALVVTAATASPSSAQDMGSHHGSGLFPIESDRGPARRTQPWDKEVLKLAEAIPVQEQGRVKPLLTFAGFKLLELNGKRSLPVVIGGEKVTLGPVEWLLDCLFFPEQANEYPCFLVQTWEVLDAIGVPRDPAKGKRDRYSFVQLAVGREQLGRVADEIGDKLAKGQIEEKHLTPLEQQLLGINRKMVDLEYLTHYLDFARYSLPLVPAQAPAAVAAEKPAETSAGNLPLLFGGAKEVSVGTLLARAPLILEAVRQLQNLDNGMSEERRSKEREALSDLHLMAGELTRFSIAIILFPPGDATNKEWLTPQKLFGVRFQSDEPLDRQVAAFQALEALNAKRGDMAALRAPMTELHDNLTAIATERGEYAKIPLEVTYYHLDLFYYALILYVFAFVGVAACWLLPAGNRLQRWLPWVVAVPFAVHCAGIVYRCILRGRPPVSTLYETILFISCIAVLVGLVMECINRRRIAVGFAAIIGAFGLFLAGRYEIKEAFESGADTMPQLQAVLDTNFWLATHVTSVTIGYAAGMLAGFIAHVYVLGKLFGLKKGNQDFYKSIARMVYGVICFGLLFSVVGTILGGVWANDSWGRFWGWDPKENGALMICLWELALLHGRMGGYLRDLGIATAAVFGNLIVAFSWWHVNQLGVGLHAYGPTDGTLFWLTLFYGMELLVVLAGLCIALDERGRRKAIARNASLPPRPPGSKTLPDRA